MIDFVRAILDNLQVMAGVSKTEIHASPELPSAFELFRPSWQALKANLFTFFYLPVLPIVVAACAVVLAFGTTHSRLHVFFLAVGILAGAAALVLSLVALPAMTYMQLKSAQKQKIELGEALAAGHQYFWRLCGVRISSGFLILVGLVLLIVPGVFMMRRYLLAPYFVLEENRGVFDAMSRSAVISREYSSATWGVVGVRWLITCVGLIPFAGFIISGVMSVTYYCAAAIRFEQIMEAEKSRTCRASRKTKAVRKPKTQTRTKKSS
jgi:hypothetical protein